MRIHLIESGSDENELLALTTLNKRFTKPFGIGDERSKATIGKNTSYLRALRNPWASMQQIVAVEGFVIEAFPGIFPVATTL